VVLQQLAQQLAAGGVDLGFQLGVFEADRLGAGQPGDDLVEALT